MSIKLKLDGFDDYFEKIKKASGSVDAAAKECLNTAANIMHSELKKQMQAANVDSDLINRMPAPEIETDRNKHTARVGYKKGAYTPNDISDGYKIVFTNYGTPKRKKHGQVKARGFIQAAKKKASAPIKKSQGECLEKITRGL